jgi:acyl-homoserine lactone acylase PvdQ
MRRVMAVAVGVFIPIALLSAPSFSADSGKGEEVTILRDDFGTPNIFAETAEGAVYGVGYAQAEDRLAELLKQYRRCEGTMSEVFGAKEGDVNHLQDDYRQRLWRHRAVAEANYPKLSPKARALCEAYQEGIKQFMKEHPEQVPAWAPELHPWQIIALSRYIIWGWPEGDAAEDLQRVGIKPAPIHYRGSNEWLVTPARTADGAPLALIDPHLGWYGQFRFYESRLYGGELQMSGMAIPGLPLSSLGHNRYCSVAMTTGGPDAADVYEEEVNPENTRQYKYDGQWRDMMVRTEVIRVKEGDQVKDKTVEFESTHHGPVVARRGGFAYAMKLPYADEFRLLEQSYGMATAKNLAEMKKALGMLMLMEQNIMVATVDGDIYYLRNGRVPVRPKGFDWQRPVPGNTSASEWLGIHPLEDLAQLTNPWQGYLQNCNVSPEHMTRFCPLTPARFADRPYLYNTDNPLHQRAAMARQILDLNGKMTLSDALDLAVCPQVYNAEVWQSRLVAAAQRSGEWLKKDPAGAKLYDAIVRWNRRADADSNGAIAYKFWKDQIWKDQKAILDADRAGIVPPEVADETLLLAVSEGAAEMLKKWGRLDVKYGDVYRVGRAGGKSTWPVSGGSLKGLATPRAISFDDKPGPDGRTFVGRGGQTSTQVVQLTNPPHSWTFLPLGESDHPESKHFDDQAEKLFSPGKLKPTYFLDKEGLMKHVESTKVLNRPVK